MKVLYIMNHADQGGAALALYDLVKEIKKNKSITPVVITGRKNKLNVMLNEIGIENHYADHKNFMSTYKKPIWIYKILLKIRYEIGKKRGIKKIENTIDMSSIDIIHTNLNRIDVGAILAKKYNIPHIWHIREHTVGDFRLMSIKQNPIKYMNSFRSWKIFISMSVKKVWEDMGIECNDSSLIYDGVRTELYTCKERKKEKKLKMLFLGGYTKNKGQEELIEALKSIPQEEKKLLHIDFYGNGKRGYIKYLKEKIKKYELDSCLFIHMYNPEISQMIPEFDVGFTCSNAEGFGRVTVEYMMSGLCPIVSNSGANPELVTNYETGIIYKNGCREMLCENVIWAINHPDEIRKIGKRAEKKSKEVFSMEKHAENIIKLYEQLLSRSGERIYE